MVPANIDELERVAGECRKLGTRRSVYSALAGAVPAPGVDLAADVSILMDLVPEINARFGLANEQVESYDDQVRIMILDLIKRGGAKLAGRIITKRLIMSVLKRMGVKITTKQVAKYVPILGTLVSAGISFASMKIVINLHISECYDVAKGMIEESCDG